MGRLAQSQAGIGGTRPVDAAFVRSWVEEIASAVEVERDHLTQLDAAIGDADHGVNMQRGFSAVVSKLAAAESSPPGKVLTTVGGTLISTVGGAAGPLYGTAFREAGKDLGDQEEFGPGELLSALRAGLEGVQRLGAATPGDKTMVDAFAPAVAAFAGELDAGGSLTAATARAREAAEEGMRATIPLQARKGRASYLGPRSVGHQDPGATSTALVFAALERVARRFQP
ncbi:MAG: dihydroxyacetone kinase subunit DhaL [Actinomycetota bacterium]|nr:dihydroxyacetone kinase subunit DhaL [Actinomycetota bacterium]